MNACVFCSIVGKKIDSEVVYVDEEVLAFKDIQPAAPFHVLVIPKKHIATLSEAEDEKLLGKLLLAAKRVASQANLADYRLVVNCGAQAGQSVFHLHVHVLGGRILNWPPG